MHCTYVMDSETSKHFAVHVDTEDDAVMLMCLVVYEVLIMRMPIIFALICGMHL